MIVIAYYFIGSTSVKRILSSRIYNAKAMNERSNPDEKDRPAVAEGPSEYLRTVVQRNRGGGTVAPRAKERRRIASGIRSLSVNSHTTSSSGT